MPEFLLREWKNAKSEVYRYARNSIGQITSKPLAPGAFGYRMSLYATEGLPPEHKQQVETLFMEPLDTAAALAHDVLLKGDVGRLNDEQRCRWAGLVMSLWFRTPGDVDGIRGAVNALFDAEISKAVLGLDVPSDFPESAKNQLAMEVMMRVIDDPERGAELINMHWDVIDIDRRRELLISDAPLCQPRTFARLGVPQSYVTMPLTPHKLFVAASSPMLGAALRMLPQRELVHRQNRASVTQAEYFVGATNQSADKFICDNFGTADRASLTRDLATKYRSASAALLS